MEVRLKQAAGDFLGEGDFQIPEFALPIGFEKMYTEINLENIWHVVCAARVVQNTN